MRSRTIAALIFGLIFVLIFGLLSMFTPRKTNYVCNGVSSTTWSILGVVENGDSCEGGAVSKSVGWPFATKVATISNPAAEQGGLQRASAENGYAYQSGGLVGNLFVYWIFGFIFFFIFAPMKRNRQMYGSPGGNMAAGNIHKY